ncbi:MAG: replication initiator protein [Microviridae sp.]|nr:MAG: replication initiator protein [Microviridae sp.]
MPCFKPLIGFVSGLLPNGRKNIMFSSGLRDAFHRGEKLPDDVVQLPCGRCVGCRLERSRQWAVRCMHESKVWSDNCFLTLTFDNDSIAKRGTWSLLRSDCQNFLKRLRQKYSGISPIINDDGVEVKPIRVFYCGEYGTRDDFGLGRPHYHFILFNFDFSDRAYLKTVNGYRYDTSEQVSELWPFGNNIVGSVTFDSCAYVARYCVTKVNGEHAKEHYSHSLFGEQLLPEFCQASLKPGIGKFWLDKFGRSDCFNHDTVISRGVKCKPPRYYDRYLEKVDPERFQEIKQSRDESAKDDPDSSAARLWAREQCQIARMKLLTRDL